MWLWLKSLCTFFLEQCRWWSGVTSSWRGSVRSCVLWVASSARWWWVHPNVAALIPVLAWCLDLVSANIMWNHRSMFTLSDVVFSSQGSDVEVEVPANLSKYMEAILAFTTHSSQVRWQHFYWRLNFRWTANESVEYESHGCFISCDCLISCSFWSRPLWLHGDLCSDMRLCRRKPLSWRWPSNT